MAFDFSGTKAQRCPLLIPSQAPPPQGKQNEDADASQYLREEPRVGVDQVIHIFPSGHGHRVLGP
jgi:hypothetical protein